jgi:hypothetical protein
MSYLDLARRMRGSEPTDPAHRLDPVDCLELVTEMHVELRLDYVEGALPWAFEQLPELKVRFDQTENAVDRLAGSNPTEADFRRALADHAAVWREMVARYRAQREAAADRADPMPELPEDAAAAVGISYGDGQRGTWDVVRRAR